MRGGVISKNVALSPLRHSPGVPYWGIYRQIPEIWQILKAFDYKHIGLAICRVFRDFSKAVSSKFFGLAKYTNV